MKHLVTALLLSTPISIPVAAQTLPTTEYTATWNVQTQRWRDTIKTYDVTKDPSGKPIVTFRSPVYRTTVSDFREVSGLYQPQFYWAPGMRSTRTQVDSLTPSGEFIPLRLDQNSYPTEQTAEFLRSTWDGTAWRPVLRTVTTYDTNGLFRSQHTYRASTGGELEVTDSVYAEVDQDIKGNIHLIRLLSWTKGMPSPSPYAAQAYYYSDDGRVSEVQISGLVNEKMQLTHRIRNLEWEVVGKKFTYVPREQELNILNGGDGFRAAEVDIWSVDGWTPYYTVTQTFDEQGRVTSYNYNDLTIDTFSFHPDGTLAYVQRFDGFGSQWFPSQGTRTIQERSNGELISLTWQRYDPSSEMFVNDRLYYYSFGPAAVEKSAPNVAVRLYPNPATNSVAIDSDVSYLSGSLVGADGKEVMTWNGRSTMRELDVTSVPTGAYVMQLTHEDGTVSTHKLAIER